MMQIRARMRRVRAPCARTFARWRPASTQRPGIAGKGALLLVAGRSDVALVLTAGVY
jgi:hypothetical protein